MSDAKEQESARKKVAVIGAGPVGIDFAVAAVSRGMQVTVFERGSSVASNMLSWGHVKLFSNNTLNCSAAGLKALGRQEPKNAKSYPTGGEYVKDYLAPLAEWLELQMSLDGERLCQILTSRRVDSVGRADLLKTKVGGRKGKFRMLVTNVSTEDQEEESVDGFDVVVDCTGTYGNGSYLGSNGSPVVGERRLRAAGFIDSRIPDIQGKERKKYEGKTTLVLGSGASAVTTLKNLEQVKDATVYWLTRRATGDPYTRIENDALPMRDELYKFGNALAKGENRKGYKEFKYLGGSKILKLSRDRDDEKLADGPKTTCLILTPKGEKVTLRLDNIIANVGYRPDKSISSEVQVHYCYASEGPMKLAASLLGNASGDCLKQVAPGPELLTNPESGFFILGMKSYGRGSRFLLRIGHSQVESVMKLLCPKEE